MSALWNFALRRGSDAVLLYALYKSSLAVRQHNECDQHKSMLFWLTAGPVLLLESLPLPISRVYLYQEIKLLYFLFLTLPQFNGSQSVWQSILLPFFTQHEQSINNLVDRVKQLSGNKLKSLFQFVLQWTSKNSISLISQAQTLMIDQLQNPESSVAISKSSDKIVIEEIKPQQSASPAEQASAESEEPEISTLTQVTRRRMRQPSVLKNDEFVEKHSSNHARVPLGEVSNLQ